MIGGDVEAVGRQALIWLAQGYRVAMSWDVFEWVRRNDSADWWSSPMIGLFKRRDEHSEFPSAWNIAQIADGTEGNVTWLGPSAKPREVEASIRLPRVDGLTSDEGAVMDSLVDAWKAFQKLPSQHPNELDECARAVHEIQSLLATRVLRRLYPLGWLTK